MCGPFASNPLSTPLVTSPLQIAYSRTGKPRVVVDLSTPQDSSVNTGIPRHTYLHEPFVLRLPGLDALLDIIRKKGPGCHVFKKDLSHAYRQLRIDPRDYHLLGLRHNDSIYFDIAPPFGLRSAAMMCQRTTVRNLQSQWKIYLVFCNNFNLVALPATANHFYVRSILIV